MQTCLNLPKKLKISFVLLLGLVFWGVSFYIPTNYSLVIPLLILGVVIFYAFNPTLSFIYSSLFLIDPMNTFHLAGLSFLPFLLSFLHLIINYKLFEQLIKFDILFKKLIRVIIFFSLYQLIFSFLILSNQDLGYVLRNLTYWAGAWLLLPSYYFTITDKNNFLTAILIIVLIIMICYFLSYFNIYQFFEIREGTRSSIDQSLKRFTSFDLRQITKIFVYIFPLFLFFPTKNSLLNSLIILIGISVYISVFLALLRTEIFYLTMGWLTATYIAFKQFKIKFSAQLLLWIVLIPNIILYFFPELIDSFGKTVELTNEWYRGTAEDQSADQRFITQLPVLLDIFYSNPLFGGGTYAVSYEASSHNLLYDIPILGAFGAYGIIGMIIYYWRYYYIIQRFNSIKPLKNLMSLYTTEVLLVVGLFAYFITMISFRMLHINIELAFRFGMPEFGIFLGTFFGLTRILSQRNEI